MNFFINFNIINQTKLRMSKKWRRPSYIPRPKKLPQKKFNNKSVEVKLSFSQQQIKKFLITLKLFFYLYIAVTINRIIVALLTIFEFGPVFYMVAGLPFVFGIYSTVKINSTLKNKQIYEGICYSQAIVMKRAFFLAFSISVLYLFIAFLFSGFPTYELKFQSKVMEFFSSNKVILSAIAGFLILYVTTNFLKTMAISVKSFVKNPRAFIRELKNKSGVIVDPNFNPRDHPEYGRMSFKELYSAELTARTRLFYLSILSLVITAIISLNKISEMPFFVYPFAIVSLIMFVVIQYIEILKYDIDVKPVPRITRYDFSVSYYYSLFVVGLSLTVSFMFSIFYYYKEIVNVITGNNSIESIDLNSWVSYIGVIVLALINVQSVKGFILPKSSEEKQ